MFIYRSLIVLLSPLLLLHIVWKAAQCRQWQYFAQRLGMDYCDIPPGCLWFHCASVGEVKTILPLLDACHARAPELRFLVTSNTPTSREIILKHARDYIHHAYCPMDWRRCVRAFLNTTRPVRCYLIETELWPNLIDLCHSQTIPVVILNGRLSEKTLHSSDWMLRTYRHVLKQINSVYTRNPLDRERYIQLGANADKTRAIGDLKFAATTPSSVDKQQLTQRKYILVVSTHDDEETQIAKACQALLQDTLFVIAPRHPERGNSVAAQLHRLGLNIALHSKHDPIDDDTQVYILDTIGELDKWYGDALAVVMGGSFVNIGGHNIIEPLAHHRAVVYGPHMQNFAEIDEIVQVNEAAIQVASVDELAQLLQQWSSDNSKRQAMEQRAAQLMQQFENTLPAYVDIVTSKPG